MALKTDKAVEVFTASILHKANDKDIEIEEARQAIRTLAQTPSPANRWEIAQIMGFVIDNVLAERMNYLDYIADVKNVGMGEKAQFAIELDGLQAFIIAKGATVERSKVLNKYITVDTEAVGIRPFVNFTELASGKVNFDRLAVQAADKMEQKMIQRIEAVLYSAFAGYAAPNYASGSAVVPATFDQQLRAFQRYGDVSIVGDIDVISQLTSLTGFNNVVADPLMVEHNQNGFIGTYKGANVVKLINPFADANMSGTVLRNDLLYIVPSGDPAMRPLKVVFEGGIQSMDQTNINDLSYEMRFDRLFGVGIAAGVNLLGVYEDTSI
jgi:hypothetical protein